MSTHTQTGFQSKVDSKCRPTPKTGNEKVTRSEYNELLEHIEYLEDKLDMLKAQEEGDTGDAWSSELMERSLAGEHPLRLWREHRGWSKRKLHQKSGVSESYLSEIEGRKKPGSASALSKCAKALEVDLADLVME